jgi:hypothetical protein
VQEIIHRHMDGQGTLTIEKVQDCTNIAEYCKAAHNENKHGTNDMKLAARIPEIMVDAYCQNNNITFNEFCGNPAHIKAMLNDPSLAHFRIWKGRV